MDSFGNGAVALINVDPAPTAVYICVCGGTDVLTPSGYRKVETLKVGDLVVMDTGAAVPILWCGHSRVSVADMRADPSRRPVRIMADAIAPGVPFADLSVSAQHRVVIEGVWAGCILLNRLSWCQRSILWGRWRRPICQAKM